MKWCICLVQSLKGLRRLSKRSRLEIKEMNLLVLVITTAKQASKEETEKSRLQSIMKNGSGQFEIKIIRVPERHQN